MRIVIGVRKEAIPDIVLNKLLSYTQMQDTCGVNMLVLDNGVPRVLTLNDAGRICQAPAAEIDALRRDRVDVGPGGITVEPKVADLVLTGIEGDGVLRFGDFLELRFEDGVAKLEFTDMSRSGDRKLRQAPIDEVRNVRILVDTSVLEIFVNDGAYVFGTRFFEESDELALSHDLKAASQVWYPMDEVEVNYLVTR
jgi:beta-fructofuranosidase